MAEQDSQQKSIADLIQTLEAPIERRDNLAQIDRKIKELTDNMNALTKAFQGLVRRDNGRPSA